MHFECNSFRACEGFVNTDFRLHFLGPSTPKDVLDVDDTDLYGAWDTIVEEYSRRDLTEEDGRLPALSNLAAARKIQCRSLEFGPRQGSAVDSRQRVRSQ